MEKSEIIQKLGFQTCFDVRGRLSIADLVPKSENRCGIYLLEFEDGLSYIGQASDVVRRFGEHRRNHPDIIRVHFQVIAPTEINLVEVMLIKKGENFGLQLINKLHVTHIAGETDLDVLLTPHEQEMWLSDPKQFWDEPRENDDRNQRIRYFKNFQKFQTHPLASKVSEILFQYILECVPAFARTERSFWSVSCLPGTGKNRFPRLCCVNINAMETFVVGYQLKEPNLLWVLINIAKSEFYNTYKTNRAFKKLYPTAEINQYRMYRAGGQDQLQIIVEGQELFNLVQDNAITNAARHLNLRLMRKGATPYSPYHCFDLVDLVIEMYEKGKQYGS